MVAREAGELLNGSWDGGKPAGDDEDDDFMMMMMMVMVMLVMLMMTMMVMMMIMMMMMTTTPTMTMTMTMMINHDDEHVDSVCIRWQTCSAAVYSMLSRANILQ
jgi:flagellar basal body-associated protein FliL